MMNTENKLLLDGMKCHVRDYKKVISTDIKPIVAIQESNIGIHKTDNVSLGIKHTMIC